jgi:hypothetical protein
VENSYSIIKRLLDIIDDEELEFQGITEFYAPRAVGHVNCMEVIKGNSKAEASPL